MSLDGFRGAAGIQYGLNVRGAAAKKQAAAPAAAAAKPKAAVAAVFSVDSDDELEGLDPKAAANALLARQQKTLAEARKVRARISRSRAPRLPARSRFSCSRLCSGASGGDRCACRRPEATPSHAHVARGVRRRRTCTPRRWRRTRTRSTMTACTTT